MGSCEVRSVLKQVTSSIIKIRARYLVASSKDGHVLKKII